MQIIIKSPLSFMGLSLFCAGCGVLVAGCGSNTGNNAPSGSGTEATTSPTAVGGSDQTGKATSLNAAGATFPYPLYTKWFETYKNKTGVAVNYQSVGSGAGIKQLAAGTVDFAASDAPLGEKDLKTIKAPVATIPTVAGAVVIAYNLPGSPQGLKMTGTNVADIFSGKITRWDDPALVKNNRGVKLPNLKINVAHRSDSSGTTHIFTHFLAAASAGWKATYGAGKSIEWPTGTGGKGNDGVTAIVKQAAGGIGYVELAYAKNNKLPYAAVQNKAGEFIIPTAQASTKAAQGAIEALKKDVTAPIANTSGLGVYPISGFTYIMTYKTATDPAKGKAIADLLRWTMTDGQSDAVSLDYAPLPKEIIAINQKTIAALK